MLRAIPKVTFSLIAVIFILTLNFYNNTFKSVDEKRFENFQINKWGERYVVARLIKAQQDGIFSEGGLTGGYRGIKNHHQIYTKNIALEKKQQFNPYRSQIGGQAITYAIFDMLTPFSNQTNIKLFRFITALLTGLVFCAITYWFYLNFGIGSALVVLFSIIYSQWITVYGRNLFWCLWSFYLPFLTVLYLLHFKSKGKTVSNKHFYFFLFLSVFIKCIYTGYEYITTTLVMMIVPFVFYALYQNWGIIKWLRQVVVGSFVGISAVLCSFLILSVQLAVISHGKINSGFKHIIFSFYKRTTENSNYSFSGKYKLSLESSISEVLMKYWNGEAFDFSNTFKILTKKSILIITYGELIICFFFFSFLVLISIKFSKRMVSNDRKIISLVCTLWFSILAPISWLVIFKGHSFIHVPMNFIIWHMPFTLFGFGVIGTLFTPTSIRDSKSILWTESP